MIINGTSQDWAGAIADEIAAHGLGCVDHFITQGEVATLAAAITASLNTLRPAKIGRASQAIASQAVRGDRIAWLDAPRNSAEVSLLNKIEALRLTLNRELMLGLEEFEGHYAHYPPGARYQRHRDRHADSDARVVSLVVYLNMAWPVGAGGELRIHLTEADSRDVKPLGGRLVVFLSERFEHEVLPATRDRLSFTGWLRRRPR